MTKICGVIGAEGNLIRAMTNSMKHEKRHRCDYGKRLGHVSIEQVNKERQPICRGEKSIIFCGKIFDYEDKKKELIEKGYKFRFPNNDAEFVLNCYEEHGEKFIREL
ncbi:hypothetical protein KY345_01125, partial [Candidatus Woesearchaeota archaeon]|nr:hypothetical protein [Candidatus Woesearchaeota archaeon]